jgi:L-alanine-DL-glutamate epimerase-like enolase superfamily enzyme
MKIVKIETLVLHVPVKAGARTDAAVWGDGNHPVAEAVLVKVITSEGIEGWGEAFGFRTASLVKAAMDEVIAPLCIGQDAEQIGALMLRIQRTLQVFGRGGPLFFGLSALDIALWDIAGKAANRPLFRLLGGGAGKLPCFASLPRYSDPVVIREAVRRVLDLGFRCLKLHETDVAVILAAREEAGFDVELTLDVNCAWTLNEALAKCEELRDVHLKWLEEPVWPPENYDGLAQLRRLGGIPIAAGENVSTLMDFDRLLVSGAVDFVQPSPAKMGGITELRKVFSLADAANSTVMTHTFYDGPGLLAAMHATAAYGSDQSMIEWRMFDLEAQIYGDTFVPGQGYVGVPQGPGLGLDPDPNVLRDYTAK